MMLTLNKSSLQNTLYLGVIFDSCLTWINHINNLCQKISKTVGIISTKLDTSTSTSH